MSVIQIAAIEGWMPHHLSLTMGNNIPLCKCELPGLDHAYVSSPPTQNRSLVNRCTCNLPVATEGANTGTSSCGELGSLGDCDADPPIGDKFVRKGPWSEERIIYVKDTWRFLSDSSDVEVIPEHEIYEILHRHGTVAGGDVDDGRRQTQEFGHAPRLIVRPGISPNQHYRLVHGIVGRSLLKCECTKQLVTAVFDAVQGACPPKYAQTVC
jgi:hypothetical protein